MKTLVKTSEMVKAIVIASLIGSLFVATAAAAAESVDESRPASPEGRIQFAAVTGDFEIIGHDAEEWLLSGTLGDDVKELVIEGGPDDWTIRLEMKKGNSGWNLNKASTDLKLLVPRRSDLDVQTVSGDGKALTEGAQVQIGGNESYIPVSRAEFKRVFYHGEKARLFK